MIRERRMALEWKICRWRGGMVLSLALMAGVSPAVVGQSESHNLVLIIADDVGVDLIGAYERFYEDHPSPGFPNTTPAIDALAANGLLFRNAWTNPMCSPTRAQILTGKPGCRSGIGALVDHERPLIAGVGLQTFHPTIPSMLRKAASPYSSAAVGKWHVADLSQFDPTAPLFPHPLGSPALPWFDLYAGSMHNLNGESHNRWTKTFATPIQPGVDECEPAAGVACCARVTDFAAADTVEDAIHLVRTLPEPFFLMVAFNAAHFPDNQPDRKLAPVSCEWGGGKLGSRPDCHFGAEPATKVRCMVQWMDHEIGRLLCELNNGGDSPELPTTTVFLGDNGTRKAAKVAPFAAAHSKKSVYDGGINVPLIIHSPVIPSELVGGVSPALVSATDLLATFAELANAPEPADPHELLDSQSIVPVLRGETKTVRKFCYSEFFQPNFIPDERGLPGADYVATLHRRAMRDQDGRKLIQTLERSGDGEVTITEQLFDLANDPFERKDRWPAAEAGEEPWASARAALREKLQQSYPALLP